jgi:3-hydroxyisobutyrate dehydrogenase-like beta-hydroxyacid dehydrogenase
MVARELCALALKQGVAFVDAPVSGGQGGAQNGLLTVMCGGDEAAFERAKPVAMAFSRAFTWMGASGAGQLTKMVNQITFAGIIQSLSEAMRFAQAAELDLDKVFESISGGAASSWQMLNRWDTMAKGEFDFGFAVDWMRKDLGLALSEARANGATLPLAALIDQFYAEVQDMGGGRQDTSALIRRLKAK